MTLLSKGFMKPIMISLSALAPSQYRKYVKGWNKGRYAEYFKKFAGSDTYRIYIPLNKVVDIAPEAPTLIQEAINSLGYSVEDYRAGIAVGKDGKRRVRIGKLLAKMPDLQKMFNEDKTRSAYKNNHIICISRHPYDIAGMSTNRGWYSCMNLEKGVNKEYVADEITIGSIVAYIIEEKDLNIKNPVARTLIKPFTLKDGKSKRPILVADPNVYGTDINGFVLTVQKWLNKNINKGARIGNYELNEDSYDDGKTTHYHVNVDDTKGVIGRLTLDDEGSSTLTHAQRKDIFEQRPELISMVKTLYTEDLLFLAVTAPRIVYDFIEKMPRSVLASNKKPAKKNDFTFIAKKCVTVDISLYERALKKFELDVSDLAFWLRSNPKDVLRLVPHKYITEEVVDGAIEWSGTTKSAKALIKELPPIMLPSRKEGIVKYARYILFLDDLTEAEIMLALKTHVARRSMTLITLINKKYITVELCKTFIDYLVEMRRSNELADFTIDMISDAEAPHLYNNAEIIRHTLSSNDDITILSAEHSIARLIMKLPADELNREILRKMPDGSPKYRHVMYHTIPGLTEETVTYLISNFPELEFYGYTVDILTDIAKKYPKAFTVGVDKYIAGKDKGVSSSLIRSDDLWKNIYDTDLNLASTQFKRILEAYDSVYPPLTYVNYNQLFNTFIVKPWLLNMGRTLDRINLWPSRMVKEVSALNPSDFPEYEEIMTIVVDAVKYYEASIRKTKIDIKV